MINEDPNVSRILEALLQAFFSKNNKIYEPGQKLSKSDYATKKFFKRLAKGVKRNPKLLGAISKEYRVPELCDLAISRDGNAIADVPPEYQTTERFFKAIKKSPEAVQFAPEHIRPLLESKINVDRLMGKNRLRHFRNYFQKLNNYFLPQPKQDSYGENLVRCLNILDGIDCDSKTHEQLQRELEENFRVLPDSLKLTDLCKRVTKYNPTCVSYIPYSESSLEIIRPLIKQSPQVLEKLPITRRSSELCLIAYLQNKEMLSSVPTALKVEVVKNAELYKKEKDNINCQQELEKFVAHWGCIVPDDFIRNQIDKFAISEVQPLNASTKINDTIQNNISGHLNHSDQSPQITHENLLRI